MCGLCRCPEWPHLCTYFHKEVSFLVPEIPGACPTFYGGQSRRYSIYVPLTTSGVVWTLYTIVQPQATSFFILKYYQYIISPESFYYLSYYNMNHNQCMYYYRIRTLCVPTVFHGQIGPDGFMRTLTKSGLYPFLLTFTSTGGHWLNGSYFSKG